MISHFGHYCISEAFNSAQPSGNPLATLPTSGSDSQFRIALMHLAENLWAFFPPSSTLPVSCLLCSPSLLVSATLIPRMGEKITFVPRSKHEARYKNGNTKYKRKIGTIEERNFRWAYKLMVFLAKRMLKEENKNTKETDGWFTGMDWDQLDSYKIYPV